MAIRTADAEWRGNLAHGSGHMRFGGDAFGGPYDFRSRMSEGKGTNPDELLGAAHVGCFSMALALELTKAGVTVKSIHTTTRVHFEERDGPSTGSISTRERRFPTWRPRSSWDVRRMPRRTAPSREPCPASILICEPSFCEVQRLDILCAYIFVWRASRVVTTG
jgi:OsmC subfamily peroxiredoxin